MDNMYSLVRLLLASKELYTGHLCSGQSASLEGNPIPDKGLGYGCPSNRPGSGGALSPQG